MATGESYRLVSFLPMALAGLALATVLRRAARPPEGYVVAGVLLALSVAAYALGRGTVDGAAAYSGTTAEVVGATFLACATVVASFLAVELLRRFGAGGVLAPLLSTGRLALTAYTLQILFLAAIQLRRPARRRHVAHPGRDHGRRRGWLLGARAPVRHRTPRVGPPQAPAGAATARTPRGDHDGRRGQRLTVRHGIRDAVWLSARSGGCR